MTRSDNSLVELPGLYVTVDRVEHCADAQTPPDFPHCFVYYITIHNETEVPITVKGRKWVVRTKGNDTIAVEGEGVVGQTPTIQPGDQFSYNSYHLLEGREAVAEGSYLCVDAKARKILARIPAFTMQVPEE